MTSLRRTTIHAGLAGGLVGGVSIWLYEAVVWAGVQKLVPLVNIPKNAVSLAFGHATQVSLGAIAYLFGTAIHFGFAMFWGVVFAILWPIFVNARSKRRWQLSSSRRFIGRLCTLRSSLCRTNIPIMLIPTSSVGLCHISSTRYRSLWW